MKPVFKGLKPALKSFIFPLFGASSNFLMPGLAIPALIFLLCKGRLATINLFMR